MYRGEKISAQADGPERYLLLTALRGGSKLEQLCASHDLALTRRQAALAALAFGVMAVAWPLLDSKWEAR